MPVFVARAQTCLLVLTVVGCGRTDPFWWADGVASESGSEAVGDGDGDTIGTSTSTSATTIDPDPTDTTNPDPTDTSTSDTSTSDTSTSTSETETSTTETTDTACTDVEIDMSLIPGQVLFLIDQGAHMSLPFAGVTRFEAIGEALFGNQGVVWSWEDTLALGLLSYTSNGGSMGGECPIVDIVPPGENAGLAMQSTFAGLSPAQDNPTPDAIDLVVSLFGGVAGDVILLTGRNPDSCANPANNNQAATATLLAAQAAFSAGITTHVVEVGDLNAAFAQQLANAGAGLDPQGVDAAPYFTPADPGDLASTLDALLANVRSCELILLDAIIPPEVEHACSFALDGVPLELGEPNDGWTLPNPVRVRLSPNACELLHQGATPSLTCDCEIYQP